MPFFRIPRGRSRCGLKDFPGAVGMGGSQKPGCPVGVGLARCGEGWRGVLEGAARLRLPWQASPTLCPGEGRVRQCGKFSPAVCIYLHFR